MNTMITVITKETLFSIVQRPLRQWRGIIFHCTANNPATLHLTAPDPHDILYADTVDYYHRYERKPPFKDGMGYHILLNLTGIAECAKRWIMQLPGAHCKENRNNYTKIGISFVGNGDIALPTDEQMQALKWLWDAFSFKFVLKQEDFSFHRDWTDKKTCPGKLCRKEDFIDYLEE